MKRACGCPVVLSKSSATYSGPGLDKQKSTAVSTPPRATTNDATRITNMDKSQRTAQGELDPGSGSVFADELEVIT